MSQISQWIWKRKEKKRKDKTRKDMIQSTAQGGLLARLINQHRLSLLWARVWTEQLGGSGGREEEAGSGHARPRRLQQNTHMAYCMHRGELSHTNYSFPQASSTISSFLHVSLSSLLAKTRADGKTGTQKEQVTCPRTHSSNFYWALTVC